MIDLHDIKLNLEQREVEIDGILFDLMPKPNPLTLSDRVFFADDSARTALYYESGIQNFIDKVKRDIDKTNDSKYMTKIDILGIIEFRAGERFK